MRRAFTIFSKLEDKLFILVTSELYPSLPQDIELDNSYKVLSIRKNVQSFFQYTEAMSNFSNYIWREVESIEKFSNGDGAIVCEAMGELFPFFRSNKSHLSKLFIKDSFNHEVVTFFGGSFNPWHEGHTECLKRCPAGNIVIVPDRNPWKEEMDVDCFFKSFMELARKFKDSDYSIFPGFYGLEKGNPTIDWLSKSEFDKKSLLIGDDNFCSFFKWKRAEEVIESLEGIYVLNRVNSLEDINKIKLKIEAINKNISISILGEHDYMSLSSSSIRANK